MVLNPEFNPEPALENERLRLAGRMETRPAPVTFDMVFEAEGGVWRLDNIGVGITPP